MIFTLFTEKKSSGYSAYRLNTSNESEGKQPGPMVACWTRQPSDQLHNGAQRRNQTIIATGLLLQAFVICLSPCHIHPHGATPSPRTFLSERGSLQQIKPPLCRHVCKPNCSINHHIRPFRCSHDHRDRAGSSPQQRRHELDPYRNKRPCNIPRHKLRGERRSDSPRRDNVLSFYRPSCSGSSDAVSLSIRVRARLCYRSNFIWCYYGNRSNNVAGNGFALDERFRRRVFFVHGWSRELCSQLCLCRANGVGTGSAVWVGHVRCLVGMIVQADLTHFGTKVALLASVIGYTVH